MFGLQKVRGPEVDHGRRSVYNIIEGQPPGGPAEKVPGNWVRKGIEEEGLGLQKLESLKWIMGVVAYIIL